MMSCEQLQYTDRHKGSPFSPLFFLLSLAIFTHHYIDDAILINISIEETGVAQCLLSDDVQNQLDHILDLCFAHTIAHRRMSTSPKKDERM